MRAFLIGLIMFVAISTLGLAAEPSAVPVGKGSYADFPAPGAAGKVAETLDKQLYIVEPNNRPVPTNTWWTDLIVSKYCGKLWAYPLTVSADEKGLNVFYPTQWNAEGRDMLTEFSLKVSAYDFAPIDARAKTWSDWLITLRLGESPEKYMDVTLGHGFPFTWIECKGVDPTVDPGEGAKFFDDYGEPKDAPGGD